jgi:hypothetical protein
MSSGGWIRIGCSGPARFSDRWSRNIDKDIVALYGDGKLCDSYVPVEMVHARTAVVSSAVPRANQQILLQNSLAERPAAARADSVKRMNFPIHVAERVLIFADRYFGGRTGRKRGER